jgi:tetratricopeptide (TPR) repeat protein
MLKSFFPVLFLLLLSTTAAVTFAGCGASEEVRMFEEAERLLSEGRYLPAVEAYSSLINAFPGSPHVPGCQYKIAFIHNMYLDDLTGAMNAYSTLLYMFPKSPEAVRARADRARIFSGLGDHMGAIEEYQWLLENGPDDKGDGFRYDLAMEYIKINDFGQARFELEELLTEQAIEAYDEVVSRFIGQPVSLEARFSKAVVLEEAGRLKEALKLLKELEDEYPNREAVKIRISSTEERLKKGPRARKK